MLVNDEWGVQSIKAKRYDSVCWRTMNGESSSSRMRVIYHLSPPLAENPELHIIYGYATG